MKKHNRRFMKSITQARFAFTMLLLLASNFLMSQSCPVINSITNSSAVCIGASITIQVNATSPDLSTLTYVWYKNGTQITGATSSQYTINGYSNADAASYTVKVSNACGTATVSNAVQLTSAYTPSIVSNVTSSTAICVGADFRTSVTATTNNGDPLSYQWSKGGTNITGATTSDYVINRVVEGDAGQFKLALTNSCGTVYSSVQQLIVNKTPVINTQPSSNQVCVGGSFLATADVSGADTYAWTKNSIGTGNSSSRVTISSVQLSDGGTYKYTATNTCGTVTSSDAVLTVKAKPTLVSVTPGATICQGTSTTLSVVANGNNDPGMSYQWSKSGSSITGAIAATYNILSFGLNDAGTYSVAVTNSCGTSTSTSVGLDCTLSNATTPVITSTFNSPASICVGENFTAQVVASSNGGGAMSYHWKKAGVLIPGATNTSLSLTNMQTTDAGIYTVEVINTCGKTVSGNLQIDVSQKPIITLQPVSNTVCAGASLSLLADVVGATAYKWQKGGVDVGNSTKTFTLATVIASNAGLYSFVASNACGTSTSSSATVVVNNKPVINSIIAPASVCAGNTAVLESSVSGNGDNNLVYSWTLNGTAIPNSNVPTLSVPNFQSANAGNYGLRVENGCGFVLSSTVGLDKNIQLVQAPVVSSVADQNPCLNTALNVSPGLTNVSGTSITYQWYFKGAALDAQRSAQLKISNIQAAQSGVYFLSVNNGCAPVSGTPFNVNVLELPVIRTQPSASTDSCLGTIFNLQVAATDAQSYQWYKDDVAIIGETNAIFSRSSLLASDAGRYNVKVSNNCGYSVTSNNAILRVGKAPTAVPSPIDMACVGQPASMSVVANTNGGGPLVYAWSSTSGTIAGATSSTYRIAAVALTDAKTYTVAVSNACGKINGGSFVLAVADKPTVSISTTIPINASSGNPSVCIGTPISFNVTSNSNGALPTYTWYKDDLSKGVQSTSGLSIVSSVSSDAGVYKLSVSNACGTSLSSSIIVGVQDKPEFVTQPADITLCEKKVLNLSALAQNKSGTSSPIIYNWYFNGNALSSTNANLTLSNISTSNTGNYRLRASNDCGSVFSDIAVVTIVSVPKYNILTPQTEFSICSATSQTKSIALNVYAENGVQPNIVWTTDVGSIIGPSNTTTIAIGSVGKNANYFATMTNACGSVQLNDGRGIVVFNEVALPSVKSFTRPPLTTFCERDAIKLNVSTNSTGYETYAWKLGGVVVQTNQSGNPSSSDFQKFATVADAGTYTVDITNNCGTLANAVSIPVTINPTPNVDFAVSSQTTQCLAGNIFTFNNNSTNTTAGIRFTWDFGDGVKDITSVSTASHTYTVSGTQVVKLTAVNEFGCSSFNTRNVVIAASPRITSQPIGKVVCEGDRYELSVTIDNGGATSLSYQWYFKGQPISNNNKNAYAITSMSASDAGTYYVKLMNSGCNLSSQSEAVNVSYQERPDVSFNVGGKSLKSCITAAEYTFTNTTPAVAGATYLWSFSDGTFYTSTNVVHKFLNTGKYDVSLTASAGGCSATGFLNGNSANRISIDGVPIINADLPSSKTVKKGDPIVLEINAGAVDAEGLQMPVNYYWYKEPSTSVIGTNSNTFNTITNALTSDSGRYYVLVNNVCGSTRSNTTFVKVHDIPTITLQPITTKVCYGKTLQLKVEGISNDNSSPLYQWYYRKDIDASPQPIPGASGPVFNLDLFAVKDVGNYFVKLSNSVGFVESNSILVVAETLPTVNSIASIPSLESGICVNTGLQLNASVTTLNNSSYTISWEQNGVALTGEESLRLNFPSIKKSNSGEIAINVTNACGTTKGKVNVNVIDIPQFSQAPSAVTTCINGSAVFSAKLQSVTDGSPFGYQWLKNGVNYSGTGVITSEKLSLSNVQVADAGYYALQSSNSCGINTSSTGKLTVVATAPSISQQPSAISTCAGIQNAVTLVASSEDNQLYYKWYKNGNILPSEVAAQLTFNAIAASDAGTYKVIVTNSCNLSTTSNPFQVVVKEKVSLNATIADKQICIGQNLGADISSYLIGSDINTIYQWRLNGINLTDGSARTSNLTLLNLTKTNDGAYSIVASNSCGASTLNLFKLTTTAAPEITTQPIAGFACAGGSFTNNVIVANAAQLPLSYQWYKDGNIISNNGAAQQLLLQNIAVADQGLYAVRVSNSCGTTQSSSGRLSLVGNPIIAQQPLPITACVGEETMAAVVATSDDNILSYSWYKDGIIVPGQIGPQLLFAKIGSADVGLYKALVTNGCKLTSTTANFQVVIKEKISQVSTIADKQICVGTDLQVDISKNLKGVDLSSSYQWKLNGVDIADASATTNTIKLLAVTKTNVGNYAVLATNSCGSSLLDLFKLGVTNLPVIETHPLPGEVCENLDWSNKVVVSNLDQIGFTYQWYKDGIPLSGANSPEIYLSNVNASNQGIYNVRLSSACGNVMSNKELFQVRAKPEVSVSLLATPPNQCLEGNVFVFKPTVSISDNSTVDLTWDFGDGVYSKQNQVSHSYQYANDFTAFLFAKSAYGCLDTAKQVVTVNTRPLLVENILNQVLCSGAQLNYNVSVKTKPNEVVGYQWFFNQEPIANAVRSSLSIDNVQKVNNGLYKLKITNACGISYSTEAELKVAEKPLVTVQLPIAQKVCEGEQMVLKPTVFSLLPNTYQWYKNGLPYVGQELDSLLLKRFSNNDVAAYNVLISNRCGSTASKDGSLIMKNIPRSTHSLMKDTVCYQTGTTLKISDYFNNDDSLFFSWYKDGLLIPGGSSAQYPIVKFNAADSGVYSISLANSCGVLNVPIAKLALNQIFANYRLDTADACKGALKVNMLDTTRSLFAIASNYWQVKEEKRILPNLNAVGYQFTNSGAYTIRHAVMDTKGCVSDTLSKYVINYGKPTASFAINDNCLTMPSIARDSSLFGYGSSKLIRYTWNFGDTVIIRNTATVPGYAYKSPGQKTLSLIVASDSSCIVDTLTKTLMVYGKPAASFTSQDSCQGFPVLFTNRSSTIYLPDSVVNFSWNFDDGTTSTARHPQHVFKQYGAYKVKLTAYSANCPYLFTDTVLNMTIKSPRANIEYPRIQTVKRLMGQLNANGDGRSYSWFPYTGLTDSKIRNPKFNLSDDKVSYTITIVDSAGCVYKDKQEVWAFNKPDIYLSSGFSPNKDGINDRYAPEYVEIKILEYFRIADKHNRQVFITNKLTDKWDGTYNGNLLPTDPYLVTVSGIDIFGNKIVRQGIVVLVK